jgi:aryl-alcohol dehydrogenase-like predicted oxidoreductase
MKVSVCPSSLIHGGGMIDSSPMYGRGEWLLGQLLPDMPHRERVLAATKIWTPFDKLGVSQIEDSLKLWGLPRLDVLQITYNLADESAEPLLPLAAERGVAVVVNRPFDGGDLFHRVAGRPLPPWAACRTRQCGGACGSM